MNGDSLVDGVLKEVDRQIAERADDDPMRLMLVLQRSAHDEIKEVKSNPAVKLGEFAKAYPSVFLAATLVLYVLSVLVPTWFLKLVGWNPSVLVP